MLTEREKWGRGNGQGNFSPKGRNTKPLKKIMNAEIQAKKRNKDHKRYILAKIF